MSCDLELTNESARCSIRTALNVNFGTKSAWNSKSTASVVVHELYFLLLIDVYNNCRKSQTKLIPRNKCILKVSETNDITVHVKDLRGLALHPH